MQAHARDSARRGRPVTAPGPIGAVARALGGMQVLAELLGRNRRSLLKAAKKGRWIEGSAGIRLQALCHQNGIEPTPTPTTSARERARIHLRTKHSKLKCEPKQPHQAGHSIGTGVQRGRPITTPGPIGEVARAMGGMQALADLLGFSRQALNRAAKEGRWIQGPEGDRLEALCRQNAVPYLRALAKP